MNEQIEKMKKRRALNDEKRLDIVMALYNRVDLIGLRTLGRSVGVLNERYELKAYNGKIISLRLLNEEKQKAISISQLIVMSGLNEHEVRIPKKYKIILDNMLEKYISGEISLDDFDFSKNEETEE